MLLDILCIAVPSVFLLIFGWRALSGRQRIFTRAKPPLNLIRGEWQKDPTPSARFPPGRQILSNLREQSVPECLSPCHPATRLAMTGGAAPSSASIPSRPPLQGASSSSSWFASLRYFTLPPPLFSSPFLSSSLPLPLFPSPSAGVPLGVTVRRYSYGDEATGVAVQSYNKVSQ